MYIYDFPHIFIPAFAFAAYFSLFGFCVYASASALVSVSAAPSVSALPHQNLIANAVPSRYIL